MLSGSKSGFDPTSDLEIKESVASEIGRRGSGRPVRELGTDTKRRFEVVLISDGEEMDGGNHVVAVLGGMGPGGRKG